MRMVLALLLAASPAMAQTGGPPTTIITPGAATQSVGTAAPTPSLTRPDAAAPQTGQLPGGKPDTAQRPTPDQSK